MIALLSVAATAGRAIVFARIAGVSKLKMIWASGMLGIPVPICIDNELFRDCFPSHEFLTTVIPAWPLH